MTRPAKRDLRAQRAGTVDRLVRFKCNGAPMDLTSWTATATVTDPAGNVLLRLSNQAPVGGSGIGWVDRAGGQVELFISNPDVANLPGLSSYAVTLTSPAGDPQVYLRGQIIVEG